MRNDKRNNLPMTKYLLISLLVLAAAIFFAALINIIFSIVYRTGDASDRIIGMLEGIIGAIATGLVLYQLKASEKTEMHQNDIEEASFMLKYNQTFIQDANMVEVERLLEDQAYYDTEKREIITPENRQKFINYLVYLESMAPLILRGVLSLEHIDNLMAYRYFLAVDNAELQDKELRPFAEYYRGCYKLYVRWKKFRKERGLENPCENCRNQEAMRELDAWDAFEKYAAEQSGQNHRGEENR